ncbi:MAG: choice-of-anchor D domain-containing protein [Phycisphaerales bacterium]|nr:choice-of-anchor D domain-containing protein [Phycisphaerales bacterium]MCB9841506.1 choice-of-anchor D domain-containing protein [Phycisphaeraceae bacterium]
MRHTARPTRHADAPTLETLEPRVVLAADGVAEFVRLVGGSVTLDRGASFEIDTRLGNAGNATAPAGVEVRYFLSTNQIVGDADDVLLETDFTEEPTAPNEFSNETVDYTIPSNTPAGTYFVAVAIDPQDLIPEDDENNNAAFTTATITVPDNAPSVAATSLDAQSVLVRAGRGNGPLIDADITFDNADSTEYLLVLSLDQIFDSQDVVLRQDVAAIQGNSGVANISVTPAVPDGVATGKYFVGLIVDPNNELAEDPSDNALFTSDAVVSVIGSVTGAPDITLFGGGAFDRLLLNQEKARRPAGTGFGPVERDAGAKTIAYAIENTGSQVLTITTIEPRGQVPGDYEVINLPDFTIQPGETSEFAVRFTPTDFGTRRANIAVFTNDPDRPRFTMKIAGRGVPPDSAADIDVVGNNNSISDGDRKARSSTATKFGAQTLGESFQRTYTIINQGQATLNLQTISIAGPDPDHFEIVITPATLVLAPNQSTTFTVEFAPTQTGKLKGEIQIFSDDPDEDIFTFRVVGTGLNN